MSKLLAKLTARGAAMDGAGGGGVPDVTASDICAAMGGIKQGVQYHILMIRGADHWPDKGETELVIQEIQNMVVAAWLRGAGKTRLDRSRIRPIAEVAWAETCGKEMTQEQVSRLIGISRSAWAESGKQIYAQVRAEIESMYFSGLSHIRKQIV